MKEATEATRYRIPREAAQPVEDRIRQATRQELDKWSNDPNCMETELCANELARRQQPTERRSAPEPFPGYEDALRASGGQEPPTQAAKADEWRRQHQQQDAFNPRAEVSADAK